MLLFSCTQKNGSNEVKNDLKRLKFKEGNTSNLNYKITFIKLETSEMSLIDKVNQIEYKNDTLFLLDSSTSRLIAFNKNGAFLKAIGKKGNGPGEFVLPVSISLSNNKARLYVVDAGQKKLIEYDSNTLEYLTERKLKFDASCGCLLNNEEDWIWNDREYQSKRKDCYFLTTNANLEEKKHYIEKEFKSGYIMAPSVSIYKVGSETFGYLPFSPVIYKLSSDEAEPVYKVEYEGLEFPTITYMNEISNYGMSSYFDKLSKSGLISYNMLLGTAHYLLACFMANDVKYIGFYELQNGKSNIYKLDDFAHLLKCGQFDYVSSSIESTDFVLPLSPTSLKELEKKGYEYCNELKNILVKTTEEDNPILCIIEIERT